MKVKLLRTFVLLLSLLVCFSLVLASCDSGSKDGDDETNPTTKTSTSSVLDSGDEGTTDSSDGGTGDEPCAEHKGGTATCTKKAECEICGEEYSELGAHTEAAIEAVAPTCTEAGSTAGVECADCSKLSRRWSH